MADSHTLGRGLHKGKSINVEANILDEWQAERRLVSDQVRIRAICLAAIVCSAVLSVPVSRSYALSGQASEFRARSVRGQLDRQLKALEADGKQAQPVLAYDRLLEREHVNSRSMLGNLFLILNAAPPKVAVQKLKAAIAGGEISIQLSADSEDSDSAKAFASEAAKGPGVVFSVLASTKKSALLGPDGLGFDIDKKVTVAK